MKAVLSIVFALTAGISLPHHSVLGGVPPKSSESKPTLYISLTEQSSYIYISAQAKDQAIQTERFDTTEFRKELSDFYESLESRQLSDEFGYQIIDELGEKLLDPFKTLIQASDEIVFILPTDLLELPIDLLSHQGQPLFVQKVVSYRTASTQNYFNEEKSQPLSLQSALLISDATADPDGAVRKLTEEFSNVIYQDIEEVNPESLREQRRFDLLLMSVHGHINNTSNDHIDLWSSQALAEDFVNITPKLTYFDSCRLGVSSSFIEMFKRIGSNYFVAPILSNEAGNSSTKTIELFFAYLDQGQRPEVALFNTRKELWHVYRGETLANRIWRAFPFRVYRLN